MSTDKGNTLHEGFSSVRMHVQYAHCIKRFELFPWNAKPGAEPIVTLHRILMLKVKARARHTFTSKQKNLF